MAKILKYVLGLDDANRFDSFFSVGAPAQDFQRYSAVDNRDDHVTDAQPLPHVEGLPRFRCRLGFVC